jgi:hypothetical protein
VQIHKLAVLKLLQSIFLEMGNWDSLWEDSSYNSQVVVECLSKDNGMGDVRVRCPVEVIWVVPDVFMQKEDAS